MTQLVRGAFDGDNPLFGVSSLEYKDPRDFVHNGGWYNAAGEKIAHGDLTLEDLGRIAAGLEAGEMFIVLSEQHTHRVGGWLGEMDTPDAKDRRCRRVAELCRIIIKPKELFYVPSSSWDQFYSYRGSHAESEGLDFAVITRKEAHEMILGHDGSRMGRLGYFLRTRLART